MSMQLHFAHSSHIEGVGIISGGPYHCAKSLCPRIACTKFPLLINTTEILQYAQSQEALSNIDPLKNLKNSKIWLQSGTEDSMIHQLVVKKAEEIYKTFTKNIKTVYHIPSHHAFLTNNYGNLCSIYGKPYMSNCDLDSAGEILNHIYENLHYRKQADNQRLFEFSQVDYIFNETGMADKGFVYVPVYCQKNPCRVHVFLHGCGMNTEYIGDALIYHSGFNEWAESNHIVIVYPQAARHHPFNYGACWDATGQNDLFYDSKKGLQISAIFNIVQDIKNIISSFN